MNKNLLYFCVLFVLKITLVFPQQNSKENHQIYLFEAGNISTDAVEYSISFSPSGNELYFARSNDKWGKGKLRSTIYYSFKKDNKWSKPVIAPFSGRYNDSSPHVSQDGKTVYFVSSRPSKSIKISADIWMIKKDSKGNWLAPTRLDDTINSPVNEYSPRTDNKGNLYFASDRPGGYGQGDLYISKIKKDKFTHPINMGSSINSPTGEWNLEISGDGRLIIFEASQRKQNISSYGDLYISFKSDDIWTTPQHLKELNTSGSDLYPELIEREMKLYYTSSDSLNGQNTNIYEVNFKSLFNRYKFQSQIP